MVEASITSLVFLMLVFGIMELGLLFRSSLATNNTAREGARVASAGGSDRDADYLVLRSVEHGIKALGLENLDMVVVYRAEGPEDEMDSLCLVASQPGECNHYTKADFFDKKENEDGSPTGLWGCGAAANDDSWCPTDRQTSRSAPLGPDYVGIYVQAEHNFMTGFFSDSSTISATTVLRLEGDKR